MAALRYTCARATPERIEVNFGDKVLLPSEALQELTHHIAPGEPLLLQLRSRGNGKGPTCFSGVLDFSAPPDTIILPGWMFAQLDLSEKMLVYITVAKLPKANSCTLRPEDSSFFALHDHRAVLETALRSSYAALAEGTMISVKHAGKIFRIAVMSVAPEPACCIIDTDLEVEVQPPVDEDGKMKPLPVPPMDTSSDSPLEIPIGHDDGLDMTVSSDYFSYAQFLPGANVPITLSCQVSQGDVEFYLGDRTIPRPSREFHCFSCSEGENIGGGVIHVPQSENGGGMWYVGVRAYGCPRASCKLSVFLRGSTEGASQALGSSEPGGPANTAQEGFMVCPNCMQQVPSNVYVRHTAFCERNNTKCSRCGQMVLRSSLHLHWHCDACEVAETPFVCNSEAARKKHLELVHAPLSCDCGAVLEMRPMMVHKRKECVIRDIICRYCFNAMKAGEPARDHRDRLRGLTQHESECGSRTDDCSVCGSSVRLKDMEIHMQLHKHQESAASLASGSSPKQPRTSSTVYTAKPVDPAAMEAMRARAWARAGYGGSDSLSSTSGSSFPAASLQVPFAVPQEYTNGSSPRTSPRGSPQLPREGAEEDALLQAALRASLESGDSHGPRTSRRVCANINCSSLLESSDGVICASCSSKAGVPRNTSAKALLPALIKAYFTQLTKGCGAEGCMNANCVSSQRCAPLPANESAVEALKLAKRVSEDPPAVFLCADKASCARRLTANELTDLGFPLSWCIVALEKVGDDKPAAATWLLNNYHPGE